MSLTPEKEIISPAVDMTKDISDVYQGGTILDGLIKEGLEKLLRGESARLEAYLREIQVSADIDGTKGKGHFYYIDLDGNGRPRTKDFAAEVVLDVLEYAVPRKAIEEAEEYRRKHNSNREILRLSDEAKLLFTSLKKSGEGGELLLYVLAESYLKFPQIICKMDLKTNAQMHYHGADGLYASVDEESSKLALHWGESKLYADISLGIKECFSSLAKLLLAEGGTGSSENRDLQLLKRYVNITDESLRGGVEGFFNKSHKNYKALIFKGIALVGFTQEGYPTEPNSMNTDELKDIFVNELRNWIPILSKEIGKNKLASYDIHTFLIPMPCVQDFRNSILLELGVSNE